MKKSEPEIWIVDSIEDQAWGLEETSGIGGQADRTLRSREAGELLRPDQALVLVHTTRRNSFVWSVRPETPDFQALAKAFHCRACRPESLQDFKLALKDAFVRLAGRPRLAAAATT